MPIGCTLTSAYQMARRSVSRFQRIINSRQEDIE